MREKDLAKARCPRMSRDEEGSVDPKSSSSEIRYRADKERA
jgi:hypothetical protein